MKLARTIFIVLSVLTVSAFVYADDSYRSGYLEGFKHGLTDKEAGFEFNYTNDLAYQAGISDSSDTNGQYREGYRNGYTEGFARSVADSDKAEFTSDQDAFKFGYKQGYNHGQIDSKTGLDFNYRRNPHFQSLMTFDTYRSDQYRTGYKDGYKDGFVQQPATSKVQIEVQSAEKPKGSVRVFTDAGFRGQMQELSVGRYPYLEDWKNEIESVQIEGNVRVILFDQNNFQGQSVVLDQNANDLDALNFNRRAASMMIVQIAE